jgi:hypothetical protein
MRGVALERLQDRQYGLKEQQYQQLERSFIPRIEVSDIKGSLRVILHTLVVLRCTVLEYLINVYTRQ